MFLVTSYSFQQNIIRSANNILLEQSQNTDQKVNFDQLHLIKAHCKQTIELFRTGFDPIKFGAILDETWRTKKKLSDKISNNNLDALYQKALSAGALGGKISGAGGGGYFMLVVPPHKQNAVRNALSELTEAHMNYEPLGSRVIVAQ